MSIRKGQLTHRESSLVVALIQMVIPSLFSTRRHGEVRPFRTPSMSANMLLALVFLVASGGLADAGGWGMSGKGVV